jgi:hypothetical protein
MSNETAEMRNQRVVEWLRKANNGDRVPPRSYLTNTEAQMLFVGHGPYTLFQDLNISGYACKFRQSVEDGIRAGTDPATWKFWHAARLRFLEYGGCYLEGHQPPRNSNDPIRQRLGREGGGANEQYG